MKKVLLFICLLFTITCVYSQEHFDFRDIPIEGNLKSYVKKLRKLGYKKRHFHKSPSYVLEGEFAGEDVTLFVYGTPKTKTVWKVCVCFGYYDTWKEIKDKYFELKDLYYTKYGYPEYEYEYFANGKDGDGNELEALKNDECTYSFFYVFPNGGIWAEMGNTGSDYYIMISYEDKINSELFSKEDSSSRLDDI